MGRCCVYILQSESHPDRFHVGFTEDLGARLRAHNEGCCDYTRPFLPWRITTAVMLLEQPLVATKGLVRSPTRASRSAFHSSHVLEKRPASGARRDGSSGAIGSFPSDTTRGGGPPPLQVLSVHPTV